ncbi:MAG: hypothetical protein OXI13_06310 [Gammaproteobacteria bacterium]|nr:hypothetical protein [Gammaproteobacteria bacterium]
MAAQRWATFNSLARRSVEAAWQLGHVLVEKKRRLGHGKWLPWLDGQGIPRRSASRFMELSRLQMGQIVPFESVSEALAAAKPDPFLTDERWMIVGKMSLHWPMVKAEGESDADVKERAGPGCRILSLDAWLEAGFNMLDWWNNEHTGKPWTESNFIAWAEWISCHDAPEQHPGSFD